MERKKQFFKCCICHEVNYGEGNNPYPEVRIKDSKCCDVCNIKYVIPARIARCIMNN